MTNDEFKLRVVELKLEGKLMRCYNGWPPNSTCSRESAYRLWPELGRTGTTGKFIVPCKKHLRWYLLYQPQAEVK
jgi:hypothetical protein